MNVTIYHYETSTSTQPYDVEKVKNVHSVSIDLMQGKKLFYVTDKNEPVNHKFNHPVYIELSDSKE